MRNPLKGSYLSLAAAFTCHILVAIIDFEENQEDRTIWTTVFPVCAQGPA